MSELKIISRHAGAVLIGQLATIAFGVTDTIVAGRYSEESLAALSVGSAIYMSVYVALMSCLQALMPLWAELQGAKRFGELGKSFRQALYVCVIAMVLGVTVLLSPQFLLEWAKVPESLQEEVLNYLTILALALPPALLFRLYSTLNQSLGKPLLVTWLQLGSLLIKVPLSIFLTFGGLGMEPMGVAGCAWATLVVNYAMLFTAFALMRTRPLYQPYRIWVAMEKPEWQTLRTFARLGIPAGLAILVEVTSFTLMALFIARLGTVAAASHQIAANLAAVMYMMPLAIGIACSSRVSYWLGAGNATRAKQVIRLGFLMALGCAVTFSLLLFLARQPIAKLYASSPEVIALTVSLLGWVAMFMVFDSMQAVGLFVLRCFRVTLLPLVVYCIMLWGLGLWGGYQLAYQGWGGHAAMQQPAAFWLANSAALGITAVIFWGMLIALIRRERSR